jgi:hypothetical protein
MATFLTVQIMLMLTKSGLGYNFCDFLSNGSGHPAVQAPHAHIGVSQISALYLCSRGTELLIGIHNTIVLIL